MISELYKDLKEIADSEYGDIIRESEIVLSYTGRARKLRLKLVDNTFITFPKHCHDGLQEKVIESNLSNIPMQAIREFLVLVRKRIIEMRREK